MTILEKLAFLTNENLKTRHYNYSDLTIKSDTGQDLLFLQRLQQQQILLPCLRDPSHGIFSLQIYHSSVNTSGGNFLQHQ